MANTLEILVFMIGGQRLALAARFVQEMFRAVTVVPLPKAPAIVEGVINVRGEVAAVLDLRSRFRIPRKDVEPTDHFIAARAGDRLVTIRADRVEGLSKISESDIQRAGTAVSLGEYLEGIAKLPDGLVLIHDLKTFLSRSESLQLDEALPAPQGEPK